MKTIKLDSYNDIPENYTGIVEYNDGDTEYFLNGSLHREDGPAVIYPDGSIFYYVNGSLHREDGPAVIRKDDVEYWFLNDKNITKEVNNWIKENNIPEVWNKSHKILFKLTFG